MISKHQKTLIRRDVLLTRVNSGSFHPSLTKPREPHSRRLLRKPIFRTDTLSISLLCIITQSKHPKLNVTQHQRKQPRCLCYQPGELMMELYRSADPHVWGAVNRPVTTAAARLISGRRTKRSGRNPQKSADVSGRITSCQSHVGG